MSFFTRSILPLCCWMMISITVNAQTGSDTLQMRSLAEVLESAIQHNPTQAVYQAQVRQAAFNYKASKGALYPNASASFNGVDNLHLGVTPVPGELVGQPGTTFYAQFGKKYAYNTGVTLSQSLFDWTNILQTKIARRNLELSRLQQDAFVQSLKEQVARLYYAALIAKKALLINQTDSLLADSILALSKQRLQEGSTDQLAVNQSAINFQNVAQSKAQSRQLYDQSTENLKILLGTNAKTALTFLEDLDPGAAVGNRSLTFGVDKNLVVYQMQTDIASLQSSVERSAFLPKISATGYFGGQQFRNDFGLSLGTNAWNAYRYIGVNISVPIFTGFANTNKYRAAKAQQDVAQLQYQNASQQSEINDRLVLKNQADYSRMVQSASAAFQLYGENLRLNQQKYREGIISMDVYLKAFQDYLTAENNYLNNLSQLLSIQATIISRQ